MIARFDPRRCTQVCPRDHTREEWIWSQPQGTGKYAVYVTLFRCPICQHETRVGSVDIVFTNDKRVSYYLVKESNRVISS